MTQKIKVVFVCMGNICRSPSAEGVFRKLVDEHQLGNQFLIDSAGTHAYHVGEPPDNRSQTAALKRNIDISQQRARQFRDEDFERYDYILAMDEDNLSNLKIICPAHAVNKLNLFLSFAPDLDTLEVPDPYYGGDKGFEYVLDLIEKASHGLLDEICQSQPVK